jgi:hypothetical protein
VIRRLLVRSASLLGAVLAVLVVAAPASARPSDGDVHGPALGAALTFVFFIVVPLAVLVIVGALCMLPTLLHRRERTPGGLLDQKALWFHGPIEPQTALSAESEQTARGGASAEW